MKTYKSLFLFATILLISSCSEEVTDKEVVDQKPLVSSSVVEIKDFVHKILVPGSIETEQDILLTAEMGGLVTQISVKEGDRVSAGQVIARVDASILASNVQELQTQLQFAEYMLEKQKELKRRGVGTEMELESAQNQVSSLKASINSLNTQKGKAIIKAPFSGVIDQVFAKQGEMTGAASPIVRLVNNKSVDITASISEKFYGKVKKGTQVTVSFPNYSDTSIQMAIEHVGNFIEPTNRTFRIKTTIKNNNYFLPNMLAELSITDMDIKDGLVVTSASILKDQNSNDFLYRLTPAKGKGASNWKVEKVFVTVIESFDGQSLIRSGQKIKEGDKIVLEGAKGITDKDIVRVK
jgi:membrane fusion protein, multidrug efflux system